jgi:hypothetical protein
MRSRVIPERIVKEGDVVGALGRAEVRWIESDEIARELESAGVFWFHDGKIVKWQPFETRDAALRASRLTA